MKKSHLIMLASLATLGLASCASDEPEVEPHNGIAIDFRPAMGSRASEITNANLNDIIVTALESDQTDPYFSNLTFTKGDDGFFGSDPVYYWPGDNKSLQFYAYAPDISEFSDEVTINNTTQEITNFVTPEKIADQVDLVTTTATGNRKDNEASGVELTFDHRLSQVEIQAKSESEAYNFEVAGIRVGRPETTGSFNLATNEWTLDMWHDTQVYESHCDTVKLTANPVSIMGSEGNGMFIPQTLTPWNPTGDSDNVARGAYLSVLVRITTTDGALVYPLEGETYHGTFGWVSLPLDTKWEQGQKYVYVLDFSHGAGYHDPDDPFPGQSVLGDPIKLAVNVTGWDDNSQPIEMPHGGGTNYTK